MRTPPNHNIDTIIAYLVIPIKTTCSSMSARRAARKRSSAEAQPSEQPVVDPQPKKKRQTKLMNKKTRETLQDSIKSIDPAILMEEVTTALTEQFLDGHLITFVTDVCEAKQLLHNLVEYFRNTFATLHAECKKEKNSQMQFQLRWYSYCSAFLLEEKYTLSAINLEEAEHAVLVNLRQMWLEFCRERSTLMPERNSVMTTLSSAVYNSLLEHVASFQESQGDSTETPCSITPEEDGVYYRFGGGTLCEMLHRRYKQIGSASNKNLMSIEISLLQAINTKDKSDIPDYLQYRDRGFMYFPHKIFIPFLKKVDQNIKKVINSSSLDEHGDAIIKVIDNCSAVW